MKLWKNCIGGILCFSMVFWHAETSLIPCIDIRYWLTWPKPQLFLSVPHDTVTFLQKHVTCRLRHSFVHSPPKHDLKSHVNTSHCFLFTFFLSDNLRVEWAEIILLLHIFAALQRTRKRTGAAVALICVFAALSCAVFGNFQSRSRQHHASEHTNWTKNKNLLSRLI